MLSERAAPNEVGVEEGSSRPRSSGQAKRQAEQPRQSGSGLPDLGDIFGGSRPRRSNRQSVAEAAIKSVVRSVGSQLGRELVRGILGSLRR
jgi:hypothetical protein